MSSCGYLGSAQHNQECPATIECVKPLSDWISTLECGTKLRGLLTLIGKVGSFGVRLGIQTTNDGLTLTTTALNADATYVTTAGAGGAKFYNFDPNGASDGNIGTALKFRLVALCKSQDANPCQGVFAVSGFHWR